MGNKFSRLEERIAWVASGLLILGLGGLLVRAGIRRLRSNQPRQARYQSPFDIVTEDSEESFPASDPPAWTLGV